MKVIDLAEEHRDLFAVCLEDWSPEVREAGPGRACWVEHYLERGLRVKLAVDEAGTVGGMIQYLPIEQWPVLGGGLYFIPCIWVHGHSQGRGDFRGKGMGPALLAAAEADARALGAQGMAAWGLVLPVWMPRFVVSQTGLPPGRPARHVRPGVEAFHPRGSAAPVAAARRAPARPGGGEGQRRGVQLRLVLGGEPHGGAGPGAPRPSSGSESTITRSTPRSGRRPWSGATPTACGWPAGRCAPALRRPTRRSAR